MIEAKLQSIREQIAILRAQEKVLSDLLSEMNGQPAKAVVRQRSPSIKPLVLDIMARVGQAGATTKEVDEAVRANVPTVAQDTVGSVLSRLKADGALVFDGERYYEKRWAPEPNRPFEGLRNVI
jgi:fructose-1-phosphate kinase PfkB-like protein